MARPVCPPFDISTVNIYFTSVIRHGIGIAVSNLITKTFFQFSHFATFTKFQFEMNITPLDVLY